jgi:hypothetical protein
MVRFNRSIIRYSAAVLAAPLLLVAPLAPLDGAASAASSTSTGVVAPPAEILSNYEVTTGHALDRDCGFTAPVLSPYQGATPPGGLFQDLWLFCDTVDYNASSSEVGAILGTDTAAEAPLAPGDVPQDLSELPTPPARTAFPEDNAPQPFLPVPTGIVLPASTTACVGPNPSPNGVYGPASPGAYPASWVTGAEGEPAWPGDNPLDVLIAFNNYCVDGFPGVSINNLFTDEGFGVVSYDPLTNRLGTPEYVFTTTGGQNLPRQQQLGDPVYYGGYLYLFSSNCNSSAFATCLSGIVYMARVPAVGPLLGNPGAYQWWTGSGWSSNYADAGNVIPSATPFAISVGDYSNVGHGIVLIAESNLVGGFQVFTAPSPTGRWQPLQTGQVPSATNCTGGEFGCYALIGHPELSTGADLMLSYFDPDGLGHLHLAAFPWSKPMGRSTGEVAAGG